MNFLKFWKYALFSDFDDIEPGLVEDPLDELFNNGNESELEEHDDKPDNTDPEDLDVDWGDILSTDLELDPSVTHPNNGVGYCKSSLP